MSKVQWEEHGGMLLGFLNGEGRFRIIPALMENPLKYVRGFLLFDKTTEVKSISPSGVWSVERAKSKVRRILKKDIEMENAVKEDAKIRYIFVEVANGRGAHGDFLVTFAKTILRADVANFILLRPAALALIEKYGLSVYAKDME